MYDNQINPGQKLRIRQWEDMADEFGYITENDINVPDFCFIRSMDKLCGKEFTVLDRYTSADGRTYYRSQEGIEKNVYSTGFWYITAGMLEPIDPNDAKYEYINITPETFFNLIK